MTLWVRWCDEHQFGTFLPAVRSTRSRHIEMLSFLHGALSSS